MIMKKNKRQQLKLFLYRTVLFIKKFKIINKIKHLYHSKKEKTILEKLLLEKFDLWKHFFKNGDYIFKNGVIKKSRNKSVFKIKGSNGTNIKARIFLGGKSKLLLVFDEITIAFYPVEQKDDNASIFSNMERYLPLLNYPKVDFYKFDYSNCCIITSTARGNIISSKKQIIGFLKDILLFNSMQKDYWIYDCKSRSFNRDVDNISKKKICNNPELFLNNGIKEVCGYVQHADVGPQNIIGYKDNYKLIDFDVIRIHPCLTDFFFLLFEGLGKFGIKLFFDGYFDDGIKKISVKLCDSNLERFKDKYLYIFLISLKTIKDMYYPFIKKYCPNSYILTKKIINDID